MSFLLLLTVFMSVLISQDVIIQCNPLPTTRVHYLAAVEEDWNYLPEPSSLTDLQRENADEFVGKKEGESRIGKIYRKAVYREYTDGTYTDQKVREAWLGILGPLLQAEVGDILEIHLLNNASHLVSLHTHGALYEKHHEGAIYSDNTIEKEGAKILPGQQYVYSWQIPPERGPTDSDPNCMVWAYHSHIHGDTDIHTGLIGPLIICKPGFLASSELTISKSYVLLFLIFDENQSWYLDQNMEMQIGNLTEEETEKLKEDDKFMSSNLMYSINGLMYDNLQGLDVCIGSSITWHLIGMGNEADIHSVTFAGQPLLFNGHRTDVVHLIPGKFVTATMKASHIGKWAVKSEVGDHFQAGMQAHFTVNNCHNESHVEEFSVRHRRQYFIAAEESMWDYAPTGINLIKNNSLTDDSEASEFFQRGLDRIGGIYKKVLYKGYTDENFNRVKNVEQSTGILGPTLRAEIGDILEVTFLNRASRPYSFQSTAFVCQNCSNEGSKAVMPGQNKTYTFFITEAFGPNTGDHECISWRYFSDVNPLKDSYSGLNGFLLICRPGSLNDNGSQKFVDKEIALLFAVMDENESHYIEDNIRLLPGDASSLDKEDPDFIESNLMHSINGLMYGNLMGIDLCLHDNVSFHLMAIGHEVDLHVANFRGNAFNHQGNYKDTVDLLPGSHVTVTMKPDILGKFLLQCQINDHIKGGMETFYFVHQCDNNDIQPPEISGSVKEYFIAAVEDEWDYAPYRLHPITGENITENEESKIFVTNDETHIGSRYKKVMFREYTDSSFTQQKSHSTHLGFLGPVIKGEIGDTIRITFFNNASREYNIKPHGVIEVSNETSYSEFVKPGNIEIYNWLVPTRAGPSKTGFQCTNWIYYSAVDIVKDTNSGLVGPLVVCNPGVLLNSGLRRDVAKEFSVLFTVMDENESWYLDDNIAQYCGNNSAIDLEDEDFKESNLKHSMNGRLYGSLEGLSGNIGDKVAWYLMGLGTEIDMHSAHFHGLTAVEKDDANLIDGHKEDVVELLPGIFRTVEMTFDAIGTWMFHCHVDDHLKAGMLAMVTVNV